MTSKKISHGSKETVVFILQLVSASSKDQNTQI
jgi:hypothetical protein